MPLEQATSIAVAPGPRPLTKSEFVAGRQCPKRLWWTVHEPHAQELVPDRNARAVMANGRMVGQVARDYVPGGALIGPAYQGTEMRTVATRRAMADAVPAVYEATFTADGCSASVDILERVDGGWALIEVKCANEAKDEHVVDAAFQALIARASGVPVVRVEVMHLNRECRHPDLSNLYVREDVTEEAAMLEPELRAQARGMQAMLGAPLPVVEIGPNCEDPHECPFKARCWPEWPEHHVSTTYFAGKKWWEWMRNGWHLVTDIPESVKLRPQARRQIRAISEGRMIVEDGLAEALAAWKRPLAYLDFETVQLPIPAWPGCKPFEQVPVQFSCHTEDPGARHGHRHYEYLADGPHDCREELAQRLVQACAGAGMIVTYNAGFERSAVRRLAEAVPSLAQELADLESRIVDLLPPVRDHVYHPAFRGSFSLKKVLPVLLPGSSYAEMEIGDGGTAMHELERLLFHPDTMLEQERAIVREQLLEYCKLDTEAMVRLYDRLVAVALS